MKLSDDEKNLLHIRYIKKFIPLRKKLDQENERFYPELNENQKIFFHKKRIEEYALELLDNKVQSFIEIYKQRKKVDRIPETADYQQLLIELKAIVDNLIREFSDRHRNNIFSSLPTEIIESHIYILSNELPTLITQTTLPLEEFILLTKTTDVEISENDEYETALKIIKSTMLSLSRHPLQFKKSDENSFRNLLINSLNGNYKGQAFAEAFNKRGKTDILIRINEKNVLIAECKIWGREKFADTIIQLLGYLSRQDEKAAIIMFSDKVSFENVLSKIEEEIICCENYIPPLKKTSESFQCLFRHPEDLNKNLYLSTLVFDVSTKPDKRKTIK